MAVTHKLFGPVMKNLGKIGDLETATITVNLMSSAYVFDQDSEYWASISTDEISTGTDYQPVTLSGKSMTYAARITTLSATTSLFCSTGSITAYFAVLKASSYLMGCVDFDGIEQSQDGIFKISWPGDEVLTFTVSG